MRCVRVFLWGAAASYPATTGEHRVLARTAGCQAERTMHPSTEAEGCIASRL
jgi:hypothetical protein